MNKGKINIILFLLWPATLLSQTGGDNVYEFLNLPQSAIVSSLGGVNVSLAGTELNLAHQNPALLGSAMQNSLALNYANYFAGINYGMALYSPSFPGLKGNLAGGLTYLNYGNFTAADPSGNITGEFTASEYAFLAVYSREIDSLFTAGITFKPVLSHLENYTSFGFAFDIGAAYRSRNRLFSAGLAIKNAGMQVTAYAGEPRQKLPFEIQAGASGKLAHAPLRFSLTLRHLEKWDLTEEYADPDDPEESPQQSSFGENLLRHLVAGAEFIPHKNFWFSAAYNYQRRSELKVEAKSSTVGFSWGFGIRTNWLDIGFGRAAYHLAGSSNHLSVILRPGNINRK
ncbi:MAG: type IX secretion system protein PorQ [Bacteroidales bacterium]|jgi:hypothetical protein|nr:type IX secretion system protein PorQ [Bacteroidales bacterium]